MGITFSLSHVICDNCDLEMPWADSDELPEGWVALGDGDEEIGPPGWGYLACSEPCAEKVRKLRQDRPSA